MEKPSEFKIRTLPRGEKPKAGPSQPKKSWRDSVIYLALCVCILALVSLHDFSRQGSASRGKPKSGQVELSSTASPRKRLDDSVTRHLQDAEIRRMMMTQKQEAENLALRQALREPNQDDIETLADTKGYGVRFDADESFERVYDDIHPDDVGRDPQSLPGDRINARLASRKWLNEMERAEKIRFLTAFLRSAYENGYELEIDSNLVVVGVKRVEKRSVNINQVIDRLAKGQ